MYNIFLAKYKNSSNSADTIVFVSLLFTLYIIFLFVKNDARVVLQAKISAVWRSVRGDHGRHRGSAYAI